MHIYIACSPCFRTASLCTYDLQSLSALIRTFTYLYLYITTHIHTSTYLTQDLGTVEALLISALEVSEAAAGCVEGDGEGGCDLEDLPPLQLETASGTGAASCELALAGADPVPLLSLEATTRAALSKLCILLCQEVSCPEGLEGGR